MSKAALPLTGGFDLRPNSSNWYSVTPMRRYLIILLIVMLAFGGYYLIQELRDEFTLENISFALPEHPEWRTPPLSDSEQQFVNRILEQPFVYLGKGHQMYAFESADQQYVLKFIKFTYLKPSFLLNLIPEWSFVKTFKEHAQTGKQLRIDRVFNGHSIAFTKDRENSGLIYIHLLPTTTLNKSLLLKNRLGFTYAVNLDQHAFVLQKKGVSLRDTIQELLNRGDVKQAKQRFQDILALYNADYQKGIYDSDHNLMYNTGFVGSQAVRLDVGRLKFDPDANDPEFIQADLHNVIHNRIQRWLKRYYPQYVDELMHDLPI